MQFDVLRHFHYVVLFWALSATTITHGEDQVDLHTLPNDNAGKKLSDVVIENHQIFENPEKTGPRLINFTHWVTRKGVIVREVWLQPGDPITEADLEELERNLRALNLFSEVKASISPFQ